MNGYWAIVIILGSLVATFMGPQINDYFLGNTYRENYKLCDLVLRRTAGDDGVLDNGEVVCLLKNLGLEVPNQVDGVLHVENRSRGNILIYGSGMVFGSFDTQDLGEYLYGPEYKEPINKWKTGEGFGVSLVEIWYGSDYERPTLDKLPIYKKW